MYLKKKGESNDNYFDMSNISKYDVNNLPEGELKNFINDAAYDVMKKFDSDLYQGYDGIVKKLDEILNNIKIYDDYTDSDIYSDLIFASEISNKIGDRYLSKQFESLSSMLYQNVFNNGEYSHEGIINNIKKIKNLLIDKNKRGTNIMENYKSQKDTMYRKNEFNNIKYLRRKAEWFGDLTQKFRPTMNIDRINKLFNSLNNNDFRKNLLLLYNDATFALKSKKWNLIENTKADSIKYRKMNNEMFKEMQADYKIVNKIIDYIEQSVKGVNPPPPKKEPNYDLNKNKYNVKRDYDLNDTDLDDESIFAKDKNYYGIGVDKMDVNDIDINSIPEPK